MVVGQFFFFVGGWVGLLAVPKIMNVTAVIDAVQK